MRTSRIVLRVRARRVTTASLLLWRGAFTGWHSLEWCPQKPVPVVGAQLCPWNARRELYQKVSNFVGSVLSPLLANIALHGLEAVVKQAGGPAKSWDKERKRWSYHSTHCIRYADDFVVFNNTWEGIQRCKEAIQEWLKGMGLALKDAKTRYAHTLEAKEECNGNVGFDFLGFTMRQYR